MSRRIALPGADELFRSTGDQPRSEPASGTAAGTGAETDTAGDRGGRGDRSRALSVAPAAPANADPAVDAAPIQDPQDDTLDETAALRPPTRRRPRAVAERRPSGRERHDEKITVYVSADELMDLEHARLALRGDHGLPVDRGRVVREALAVVLADFEAKGEASILVRRLRGR